MRPVNVRKLRYSVRVEPFLNNKYTRWYEQVVQKARDSNRVWQRDTYHKHHILPKSLGGKNDPANLVLLTPREHYICHRLLIEMTVGKARSKMAYAFFRFSPKERPLTSRGYEKLRAAISGYDNPFFGRKHTAETKAMISANHGMRGKGCFDVWVANSGLDEANRLQNIRRQRMSEALSGSKNPNFGTHRTETQKFHQSQKMSGSRNPNFGLKFCWMSRQGVTKKVDPTKVPEFLSSGWVAGRKR